jgi:hypothetical protein
MQGVVLLTNSTAELEVLFFDGGHIKRFLLLCVDLLFEDFGNKIKVVVRFEGTVMWQKYSKR